MIRYALACDCGHDFEAWFSGSQAYEDQKAAGLVTCPVCGAEKVRKQIMAPAISRRAEPVTAHSEQTPDLEGFAARVRAHVARNFVYVGDRFADEARKAHASERGEKPIWGQASPDEVKALSEEGVPIAPLPEPFAPPPPPEPSKLN